MRCPTVGRRAHLTTLRARPRAPEVVSNPQEARAENSSPPPRRLSYNSSLCRACPFRHSPTKRQNLEEPPQDVDLLSSNDSPGFDRNCSGCINIPGPEGPRPPQIPGETPQKRLQITHLNPAMLVYRVEPSYPTLASQTTAPPPRNSLSPPPPTQPSRL